MGVAVEETKDATRRTRLANERTYLAWWRTGLTCLAVSVGVGRIVPGIANVKSWPYQAIGVGYGLFGIAFMVVAHLRVRTVERAVDRGEFARMDGRVSFALLVTGTVLGVATILLILFEG
jgi:putative membrane protein